MRQIRTSRRLIAAIVAVLTVIATVGIAFAATPDANEAPADSIPVDSFATGVTSRAQTALDRSVLTSEVLTIGAVTEKAAGVTSSMLPGDVNDSSVRILIKSTSDHAHSVYAFKTTGNRTCIGVTSGPLGCITALPADLSATFSVGDDDGEGTGAPAYIYGLTSDDVQNVTVVIDGANHQATVGPNSFFLTYPSGALRARDATELILSLTDGSTRVQRLW